MKTIICRDCQSIFEGKTLKRKYCNKCNEDRLKTPVNCIICKLAPKERGLDNMCRECYFNTRKEVALTVCYYGGHTRLKEFNIEPHQIPPDQHVCKMRFDALPFYGWPSESKYVIIMNRKRYHNNLTIFIRQIDLDEAIAIDSHWKQFDYKMLSTI